MKWLLITDNNDLETTIGETLKSKDSTNELIRSAINKDSLSIVLKDLKTFAGCLLFSNQNADFTIDEKFILSNLAGILLSNEVPVLSNIAFLSEINLIQNEMFHICEDENAFFAGIDSHYEYIATFSSRRICKNSLLDKGIPFTPDCFANYIAKNKEVIINEFLSAGMGVNVRDDTGTPMLNIACRNDNYEIVEQLLDLGAELNAISEDRGYTAVMDAIWRGNEKITKYLISKGADLNTINKEGQTNLILAVGADRLNLVKLLAENGADPDVKDMMGMSAYNYATLFRKEKMVEILKPYHKDV